MQVTTPADCRPTPLYMHVLAFLLVCLLPCLTTWAVAESQRAVLLCAAAILLPRVLGALNMSKVVNDIMLAWYWNVVFVVCICSPFFIVMVCYLQPKCSILALTWLTYSRFLSRPDLNRSAPWREFAEREWGYHAFRRFLSLRLHVDPSVRERPPESPLLISVHPHGIASDYRILMDGMLYHALPGRTVLTLVASVLFWLPLVRELCVWTRCIDASKKVAERALRRGDSLMVIPGGEAEQIRTRKGVEEVLLAKRFGFVKLALAHSAALVPCYCFGCVDLYDTYDYLHAPREALRKHLGICLPLYRGSFGMLPRRVPLDMVFGPPIDLPPPATPGKPTDEEVAQAHARYVAALKDLFDKHKTEFGFGTRQLNVV